jgi:hypothetical protein
MKYYRLVLLALVVGAALAAVSIFVTGFVAALPVPGLPPQLRHDHARLILPAMDLIGELPIVLLAWVVGHVMIRATKTASLLLFVGTPWVLLGLYDRVSYLRNCGATLRTALSVLLSGHYLEAWAISILAIPAGLWLASMTKGRRHG